MPRQNMNLLCTYRYDPLDRLVACATSAQASTQRFYQRDRLATEIQGTVQLSIMQHDDHLLAQQQRQGSAAPETSLLATDQQRSVLTLLDAKPPHAFAYMPYGYCFAGSGLLSLLGFNGERPDPVTGWYLLGNGYRAFNPVLMRFTNPDSARFSPFEEGGLNTYAYCAGDPLNRLDPTGHAFTIIRALKSLAGKFKGGQSKTKPRKHSLDGTYKKINEPKKSLNPLASKNRQQDLAPSTVEPWLEGKASIPTADVLTVLIEQRQQTIKNLLGQLATTQSPSEQQFLRTTITTLDKGLVNTEKKLNELSSTLPSTSRAIRENLPKK